MYSVVQGTFVVNNVRESKVNCENYVVKDENCFSERDLSIHQTQKICRETSINYYSPQMNVVPEKDIHLHLEK